MRGNFYQEVYKIVSNIPKGKVLTYKDVARLAGSPRASRAVGTAMRNNPDRTAVWCHRVVGSDGKMHGYANGGENVKVKMLKEEGVEFRGAKVDLTVSRWRADIA